MPDSIARAIEEFFRNRYGRDALYVPSGRAALYFAFREWLRPGDRLLMSPVTDDVVFFVVLAAGLVPVQVSLADAMRRTWDWFAPRSAAAAPHRKRPAGATPLR